MKVGTPQDTIPMFLYCPYIATASAYPALKYAKIAISFASSRSYSA